MINIKVNNDSVQTSPDATITSVLSQLDIATNGIAVAVDNTIVTKSDWETTLLKENQNILIIKATQGG